MIHDAARRLRRAPHNRRATQAKLHTDVITQPD
jgi:hypothetical protein